MNSVYNYLLEANLCLLVFGAFYYIVLKHETHFLFLRYYLIGSALLAVSIPLLQINNPFAEESTVLQPISLPEFVPVNIEATEVSQDAISWSWPMVAIIIYGTITAIFLSLLCWQIYQIFRFRSSKRKAMDKKDGYVLILTDGQLPTFSFFNMLFLDNSVALAAEDKQKIIDHELVHIRQWHSLDMVVMELTKIMLWMNPVAWWMRRNLRDVHEYLADQHVLKSTDQEQYSSLLAKMALKHLPLSVAHHFSRSLTLKRIIMMKSPKTKFELWKWATMIPLIILLTFVLSCNDEVMDDVNQVMETATQAEVPESLLPELTKLQEKHPGAEFVYIETDGSNIENITNLKEQFGPNSIAYLKVWEEKNMIGAIVNNKGPLEKLTGANDDQVYQIVEDPARPIGGYKAFYQKFAERLVYPEKARELGIEGKIFIQFVVDIDGSITDVKAVKSYCAGCEEAAITAVSTLGPFKPAFHRNVAVKQKIILPVNFSLNKKVVKEKAIIGPIGKPSKANEEQVFEIVDNPATPKGGYEAFYQRIADRLVYPEKARKMGVEGKVYIQFVVDIDGSLIDIKAVKGIGAGCDEAAIEALRNLGPFNPASDKNVAVKQRIILPITFKSNNVTKEKDSEEEG